METRQNPAEMLNPGTARTPSPPNRIQKIEHKSRSNSPLDFFFFDSRQQESPPPKPIEWNSSKKRNNRRK
jgi:hypothetical protein